MKTKLERAEKLVELVVAKNEKLEIENHELMLTLRDHNIHAIDSSCWCHPAQDIKDSSIWVHNYLN